VPILLVLAIAVATVWALNAQGQQFPRAFARLLGDPALDAGVWAFLSGRLAVSGTFAGRDVVLRLHLKRGRHDQGWLTVSMRTRVGGLLDAGGVDSRTAGDAGRRALFTLAKHDLMLSVEGGRLTALWKPQGFVLFPGSFADSKWREVLDAMHAVAQSLDATE
jgi:hypothetical protein